MEQNKNGAAQQPAETNMEKTAGAEQGRQPQDAQQAPTEQGGDISQIDQQEGQMNNGELGGNFDNSGSVAKQA